MYLYLAIAILSAALSGWGVWTVQDWRHDSIDKARMEAAAEKARFDRRAIDLAAVGHEKDKGEIRTEFLVITEKVYALQQDEFYAPAAPACLDASGVRLYNESATGPASAASQPAPAVRGLNPLGWWKPSGSAAKAD